MVYRGACPTYLTTINAAKYCNAERGSGDRDEIGGIANRGNHRWNESDLGPVGQFNITIARHKKGLRKIMMIFGAPIAMQVDIPRIPARHFQIICC